MSSEKVRTAWKRIDKEIVFETPVFNLFREKSRSLRTGAENDFYYFACVDWVNVAAITPDKHLVMIRQFRHGSERWEMEIPGGGIDRSDSNPVEGGVRELFEETGYRGSNARIIGKVCPNPALQGNFCYTVMIENAVKVSEPEMEATEDIETTLIPLAELRNMIKEGIVTHGLVLNALHFLELSLH
ncbi:MAG: hypothetical protein A2020_12505 [Lentisphaerae bacterium GWF2_45_14]|nr:MAG: hypothetical protein A2020_12505 [Lentisphaerae bacterium GWF2_45_14]